MYTIPTMFFFCIRPVIKRVGSIDAPVPHSPPLEEFFLPNSAKVIATARELLDY